MAIRWHQVNTDDILALHQTLQQGRGLCPMLSWQNYWISRQWHLKGPWFHWYRGIIFSWGPGFKEGYMLKLSLVCSAEMCLKITESNIRSVQIKYKEGLKFWENLSWLIKDPLSFIPAFASFPFISCIACCSQQCIAGRQQKGIIIFW